MSKFKIGDKVRLLDVGIFMYEAIGKVGTVLEIVDSSGSPYIIGDIYDFEHTQYAGDRHIEFENATIAPEKVVENTLTIPLLNGLEHLGGKFRASNGDLYNVSLNKVPPLLMVGSDE